MGWCPQHLTNSCSTQGRAAPSLSLGTPRLCQHRHATPLPRPGATGWQRPVATLRHVGRRLPPCGCSGDVSRCPRLTGLVAIRSTGLEPPTRGRTMLDLPGPPPHSVRMCRAREARLGRPAHDRPHVATDAPHRGTPHVATSGAGARTKVTPGMPGVTRDTPRPSSGPPPRDTSRPSHGPPPPRQDPTALGWAAPSQAAPKQAGAAPRRARANPDTFPHVG